MSGISHLAFMQGVGFQEILVILVVVLVLYGPDKLPGIARKLGKIVGDLRRTSDDFKDQLLKADQEVSSRKPDEPAITTDSASMLPQDGKRGDESSSSDGGKNGLAG